MMNYTILGVCSGNVQRSPTCEAVLKYTVHERRTMPCGLDISSAGVNVRNILENSVALPRMVAMIDAALHYGLMRDDKRHVAEKIVHKYSSEQHNRPFDDDDAASISVLYAEVRPLVHGMLTAFRNIALQRAHVPKQFVPSIYRPFPIGSHLDVILAMDEVVQDKVNELIVEYFMDTRDRALNEIFILLHGNT